MPRILELTDEQVIQSFPMKPSKPAASCLVNFLGVRTRKSFCKLLESYGDFEGYPIPANWHGTQLEWSGTLRSVLEAQYRFVAVELGAGWAPWLVSSAHAAQQRGIQEIKLIGVEGCARHHAFMVEHFRDNGLDPHQHELLFGVVGLSDGVARFPAVEDATATYGEKAELTPRRLSLIQRLRQWKARLLGRRTPETQLRWEEVKSFSLATVLGTHRRIDLMHIDIQGHEYELITASPDLFDTRVYRMVIGTHAHEIHQNIDQFLRARGWILEGEEPCEFETNRRGQSGLSKDGCQVWRNPALALQAREAA
ncbi:MAG: FkbM family methyltransferase [Gemmataceae bacterium]